MHAASGPDEFADCWPAAAHRATLAQLDLKFRALHVYNSHVLDSTHIAAAYLDLATSTLHLASNGGCRAVVTTRDALGRSQVAVELGRPSPDDTAAAQDAAEAAAASRLRGQRQQQREQQQRQPVKKGASLHASGVCLSDDSMVSMRLSGDVESIVLGSAGLWCVFYAASCLDSVPSAEQSSCNFSRLDDVPTMTNAHDHLLTVGYCSTCRHEMPVEQAALRVATGASISPHAMGGNSAALLAQVCRPSAPACVLLLLHQSGCRAKAAPDHLHVQGVWKPATDVWLL